MAAPPPNSPREVRQGIIQSLFSTRGADGQLEEQYISHVKIWEDEGDGTQKLRFLLLGKTKTDQVFIHKAKQNSNLTYSKGKTWELQSLRGLEVVDRKKFNLSFTRTYRYVSGHEGEQAVFVRAVVEAYRRATEREVPNLIGYAAPPNHNGIPQQQISPQGSPSRPGAANGRMPSNPIPSTSSPLAQGGQIPPQNRSQQFQQYPNQFPPSSQYQQPYTQNGQQGPSSSQPSSQFPMQSAGQGIPRISSPLSQSGPSPLAIPQQNGRTGYPPQGFRPSPLGVPGSYQGSNHSEYISDEAVSQRPVNGRKNSVSSVASSSHQQSSGEIPLPPTSLATGSPSGLVPPLPSRSPAPSVSSTSNLSNNMPIPPAIHVSPSTTTEDATTPKILTNSPRGSPLNSKIPLREASSAPLSSSTLESPLKPASISSLGAPAPSSSLSASNIITSPAKRRVSIMPPQPLQTTFSRDLLLSDDPINSALTANEDDDVILSNVEELLEGFEWDLATSSSGGLSGMEKRLAEELSALEGANIHSFLETDDRIESVMNYIDQAVSLLDDADAKIVSYKIQLNAVADDISHIESQNRGLQVQTSNQKALLAELENLLTISQVDRADLMVLTQGRMESDDEVKALEESAASLYKALQAGRDNGTSAGGERLQEYEQHNAQFCKRISENLTIRFKMLADQALASRDMRGPLPTLKPHEDLEAVLGRYCGLVLYMKEMEENCYQKFCAMYFGAASDLHKKEVKDVLMAYINRLKKTEDESPDTFVITGGGPAGKQNALTRNLKGPSGRSDKNRRGDDLTVSEAYERLLTQIATVVYQEEAFIADFLQITDNVVTFADYMGLESYFRRYAARILEKGMSPALQKLLRSSMDLIFGFLVVEMENWVKVALQRDPMQIVGMMAASERLLDEAEARNADFLNKLLQKQLQRLTSSLDRFIAGQIKAIEETRLTVKKRKGVAPFVRHFPAFIDRFEGQLVGAEGREIRVTVDSAYEKIANAMFESLQQMAKMDGTEGLAAEDKGQLNYHVILIENMHCFIGEMSQHNPATFQGLLSRAQGIYQENLDSYLRLDFFEGVERLLQSAPPSEVSVHAQYNKAALKRVLKEFDSKDIRKSIDALYKRVYKHFDQSGGGDASLADLELIDTVIRECQNDLMGMTNKYSGMISSCWVDQGVGLDFTANDIAAWFKRAKSGN